ncbi:MAG: Ig domain-containing protein, partial [Acidimicrobiia bacterium]|nr:Ig domain-containing protein [Acidimicrobiia bacterium]
SEGDGLTFSASGLPAGAVMDSTGLVTGTLVGPAGTYTPVVTVSDGTTEVSTSFSWVVSEPAPPQAPPEFAATADWIDTAGNVFPTLLADLGGVISETAALDIRFTATDPDGGAVTFSASGLPVGLTMDVDGRLSGAAAPGTARGEPYQATITAASSAGATDVAIEWQVAFGPGATCEAIAVDFTYANAVAYWLREDQPVGLDVDGNGLPCVAAFVGLDRLAEIDGFYGPADFAAGLTCTDLADQSYDTVVAYWLRRGQPTNLDEGFGLPCDVSREGDAAAFYLFEGSG